MYYLTSKLINAVDEYRDTIKVCKGEDEGGLYWINVAKKQLCNTLQGVENRNPVEVKKEIELENLLKEVKNKKQPGLSKEFTRLVSFFESTVNCESVKHNFADEFTLISDRCYTKAGDAYILRTTHNFEGTSYYTNLYEHKILGLRFKYIKYVITEFEVMHTKKIKDVYAVMYKFPDADKLGDELIEKSKEVIAFLEGSEFKFLYNNFCEIRSK